MLIISYWANPLSPDEETSVSLVVSVTAFLLPPDFVGLVLATIAVVIAACVTSDAVFFLSSSANVVSAWKFVTLSYVVCSMRHVVASLN